VFVVVPMEVKSRYAYELKQGKGLGIACDLLLYPFHDDDGEEEEEEEENGVAPSESAKSDFSLLLLFTKFDPDSS